MGGVSSSSSKKDKKDKIVDDFKKIFKNKYKNDTSKLNTDTIILIMKQAAMKNNIKESVILYTPYILDMLSTDYKFMVNVFGSKKMRNNRRRSNRRRSNRCRSNRRNILKSVNL
jgi:hypothetical protein